MRELEDAPPPMPINIAQLQLPESYQTYQRSEGREERFLLADSELYEENGQMHRFVNGNGVFGIQKYNLRILIFGRESHGNWANNMLEVCG